MKNTNLQEMYYVLSDILFYFIDLKPSLNIYFYDHSTIYIKNKNKNLVFFRVIKFLKKIKTFFIKYIFYLHGDNGVIH